MEAATDTRVIVAAGLRLRGVRHGDMAAGRCCGSGLLPLLLAIGLCGCSRGPAACLDGGDGCAAAAAPPGQRRVLKGYRIVRLRWIDTTNRESGAADIGTEAQWQPITEWR
jgi:hypothetical protein